MISFDKIGSRTIVLFCPFKCQDKTIESITLGPMVWDHTLKWQDGEFKNSLSLLFALSDQTEEVMRQLRYPDVDRVMDQFFAMIPPEIREQIASGVVPQKVPAYVPEPENIPEDDQEEIPEEIQEEQINRMPTQAEIEADLAAHPVPEGGFGPNFGFDVQ